MSLTTSPVHSTITYYLSFVLDFEIYPMLPLVGRLLQDGAKSCVVVNNTFTEASVDQLVASFVETEG